MAREDILIVAWDRLDRPLELDTLIVGNGGSIALHPKFNYKSLHGVASKHGWLGRTERIFKELNTDNFEEVLLALEYAATVNRALRGDLKRKVARSRSIIRGALINSVRAVHCRPNVMTHAAPQIDLFCRQFKTIVTLNYDLTLYWVMNHANGSIGGSRFKDGFVGPGMTFDPRWRRLRAPIPPATEVTMVFFGHGSLLLATDSTGREYKITNPTAAAGVYPDLLETVFNEWRRSRTVPLFVSEGSKWNKSKRVRNGYLGVVHNDVLSHCGRSVVVYGFSFGKNDDHVIDALEKSNPSYIAVSVYTGGTIREQQAFAHQVSAALCSRPSLSNATLEFFDASSPGCWMY